MQQNDKKSMMTLKHIKKESMPVEMNLNKFCKKKKQSSKRLSNNTNEQNKLNKTKISTE